MFWHLSHAPVLIALLAGTRYAHLLGGGGGAAGPVTRNFGLVGQVDVVTNVI